MRGMQAARYVGRTLKTRLQFALAGLMVLSAPSSALACGSIVPFVKAVGGPGVLVISFIALGLVVLLKSAAFARFQKKLSFPKALFWMLGASVLTSIVGVTAPAMVENAALLLIGMPVVWALCLLPVQRVIAAAPVSRLARYSPRVVAFGMTVLLVLSYYLFTLSRVVSESDSSALYWTVKIVPIFLALIIGLALTAFWEEWIVWRLSRSEDDDVSFVKPIVRANLIVLLVVMLISAAFIIPKRLKSPGMVVRAKPQAALEHISYGSSRS